MRLYRIVMRSGANMDILAKSMIDDPSISDDVYFYHDETLHQLAAKIRRKDIAGVILLPPKSSAYPHMHTGTTRLP